MLRLALAVERIRLNRRQTNRYWVTEVGLGYAERDTFVGSPEGSSAIEKANSMNSSMRIGLGLVLGFVIATITSFINGRDVGSALQAGLVFALIVGVVVAVLSWGMDMALEKGYPGWFGFFLALCLNIVGLVILALLPAHTTTK